MKCTRELKQIVTNLIKLYLAKRWQDMAQYQIAIHEGLSRYELAVVKQAFNSYLMK